MNRPEFERFATQYWGQKVAKVNYNLPNDFCKNNNVDSDNFLVKISTNNITYKIEYLQLRSISNLTESECIELFHVIHTDKSIYTIKKVEKQLNYILFEYDILERSGKQKINCTSELYFSKLYEFREPCDYLKSIGVLVPFAQYSISQLLSLGWVVIKQ